MTRVSPPDDARELPAPQASTRVTRKPARRSARAVHPPNAPAPTTTACSGATRIARRRETSGAAAIDATNVRRETFVIPSVVGEAHEVEESPKPALRSARDEGSRARTGPARAGINDEGSTGCNRIGRIGTDRPENPHTLTPTSRDVFGH